MVRKQAGGNAAFVVAMENSMAREPSRNVAGGVEYQISDKAIQNTNVVE